MLEGIKRAFQRENQTTQPHYPLLQDISLLPDIAETHTDVSTDGATTEINRTDSTTITASLRKPQESDFYGHAPTWQEAQTDNMLVLNTLKVATPQKTIDLVEHFYQDTEDEDRPTIVVCAGNTHLRQVPHDLQSPHRDTDDSKLIRSLFLHKPSNHRDTSVRFSANTVFMATLPISDLDFATFYHELAELKLYESDPQAEIYYANHAKALADMQQVLAEAGYSSKGLSREEQLLLLADLSSSSSDISVRSATGAFLDANFRHEIYKKRKRIQTEQAANRMMTERVSRLMTDMGHESSIDLIRRRKDVMNYSYQLETDDFFKKNAQILQNIGLADEVKTIREEYTVKDRVTQAGCHAILMQWLSQRSQPFGRPRYQSTSV